MVQIIRRTPHKTTSDYMADALRAYGEGQGKKEAEEKRKQSLSEENKAFEEKYGIDLKGVSSKEGREFLLKQGGKEKEDRDYFPSLREGDQPQRQENQPPVEESPNQVGNNKSTFSLDNPSSWSDEEVNKFRAYKGDSAKPKSYAQMAENEFLKRKELKKETKAYEEKIAPYKGALKSLDRMEEIGKNGKLGIGSSYKGIIDPKARKDAGEYTTLAKSLASYITSIPIRNQAEFQAFTKELIDPTLSDDKRAGIISAMKRIIENAVNSNIAPEGMNQQKPNIQAQQTQPPLTAFLE